MGKNLKAKSFEDILLIGVKTIKKVVADKCDPSPVIKHVKFLAEKATKKMFEPVAYIKYDEAVRERANGKGISQFSITETDKAYPYFSLENTVKVTGKGSGNQKGGCGPSRMGSTSKAETHCTRFNNYEIECKGKCSYLHACYVCDSCEHGKCDCPKKSNSK